MIDAPCFRLDPIVEPRFPQIDLKVEKVVIEANSCNDIYDGELIVTRFNALKAMYILNHSFKHIITLFVYDCPNLQILSIGKECFTTQNPTGKCMIKECPNLATFECGEKSCEHFEIFLLSGKHSNPV